MQNETEASDVLTPAESSLNSSFWLLVQSAFRARDVAPKCLLDSAETLVHL